MISLLKRIFVDNWLRKLISLILAIIIWCVVYKSLTTTKTISSVGVRVINLPQGKTISGLQSSGLLSKRLTITLTGQKSVLEDLSANDLEVTIDANNMGNEWIATIGKNNLQSLNPQLSIPHHITKLGTKQLIIKLVQMSEEKIPVYITPPIGEAPKGYQFLDVWPYQLNLTVRGPEETIKKLKARGVKLTFNLNDISLADLGRTSSFQKNKDVISYFIPSEWKLVNLPTISDQPLAINDADAALLRIDFVRSESIPLTFPIPVNIFIPPDYAPNINPQLLHIGSSELIQTIRGIKLINQPLYTKGVSALFVKIIRDMVTLSVNLSSKLNKEDISWSIQFINPTLLEDRYVSTMIADDDDEETKDMHPRLREEYIRNRFRNYMNRFQLFTQTDKPLNLDIELKGKEVLLREKAPPAIASYAPGSSTSLSTP